MKTLRWVGCFCVKEGAGGSVPGQMGLESLPYYVVLRVPHHVQLMLLQRKPSSWRGWGHVNATDPPTPQPFPGKGVLRGGYRPRGFKRGNKKGIEQMVSRVSRDTS